jgi:AcrR family transcriptional regulator
MEPNQNQTLGKDNWFLAGLEALADGGPELLKAAKIARMLGVTTGSFYWHFRSVPDFRTELLEYWQECVVVALIREARAAEQDPALILAHLRKRILKSGAHPYDAAMRVWAEADPAVRETVACADAIRGTFLVEMLSKSGLSEEEARDRAGLIAAAWRGSLGDVRGPKYRLKLIGLAAAK